jgi:hypothetical protein
VAAAVATGALVSEQHLPSVGSVTAGGVASLLRERFAPELTGSAAALAGPRALAVARSSGAVGFAAEHVRAYDALAGSVAALAATWAPHEGIVAKRGTQDPFQRRRVGAVAVAQLPQQRCSSKHLLRNLQIHLFKSCERHLVGERDGQDAAGAGPANEVKQLVDWTACTLLDLLKLPDESKAFDAAALERQKPQTTRAQARPDCISVVEQRLRRHSCDVRRSSVHRNCR